MAVANAQIFIPILTPGFFTSKFCRREAFSFLNYETKANRDDLILPIYMINAEVLEDPKLREKDDLAIRLLERQYDDWRELKYKLRDSVTRPKIDKLAKTLAESVKRGARVETPKAIELGEAEPFKHPFPEPKSKDTALGTSRTTMVVLCVIALMLGMLGGWIAKTETSRADTAQREELTERLWSELHAQRQLTSDALAALDTKVDEPAAKPSNDFHELLDELKGRSQVRARRVIEIEKEWEKILRVLKGETSENAERTGFEQIESATDGQQETQLTKKASLSDMGRSFQDCQHCPEMVALPPDAFLMGSPDYEIEDFNGDEAPQHKVTIGYRFALGKYEVTHAQFERFVAATGHEATGCGSSINGDWVRDPNLDWRNPGFQQNDDHPVVLAALIGMMLEPM